MRRRKSLLALNVLFAFTLASTPSRAQQPPPSTASTPELTGNWQGTLQLSGRSLRIVLKIARSADGALTALNYSIDQTPEPMQTSGVTLQGHTFRYAIPSMGQGYEGQLSPDGNSIAGKWAGSVPLVFVRATKETAWEIPAPPPPKKPMTATDPSFEVATVKPTDPDKPGRYFRVTGRTWTAHGASLTSLIQIAYGLHPRQIVGGPEWVRSAKFDITGTPDAEGEPNGRQWLLMVQKLLADRFGLVTHRDKQDLSTFVLEVAPAGPKGLTPSKSGNPLPTGLEFRPIPGGLLLPAGNTTMPQFCQMMQQVVLDRPMVDHTGLTGRYDFQLRFAPDETQFDGHPPASPDSAGTEPLPSLIEALRQQLDLKLGVEKVPTDVLVIDRVREPSPN